MAGTENNNSKRKWMHAVPWYYVTRGIGVLFLLYGLLGDASTDRGTIILTGAGLLGIDKVARSEGK